MTDGPAQARLLTAPARGGIAVISLTGCGAEDVLRQVFRPGKAWPKPGELSLGKVISADDGAMLDEAVVSVWHSLPGCAGQTTWHSLPGCADQTAIELNIHGGPQVARAVLGELQRRGADIAPSVEIDPLLARPHPRWNNPALAAEMAAALRDAITPLAAAAVARQWSAGLSQLASSAPSPADLRACAARWPTLRRLLEPAEVVVAGQPNAGKSSLVNALAGRDVSIVSDIPGTTRDWVHTLIDLDGVPIWLTDTAGLWEETFSDPGSGSGAMLPRSLGKHNVLPHEVDREAMERAWQRIAAADLVLCLTAGEPATSDRPLLARALGGQTVLHISSKADCIAPAGGAQLAVSAKTFAGMPELRQAIIQRLGLAGFDPCQPAAFTARQAALLTSAAEAMETGDRPAAQESLRKLLGT